MVEIKEVEVRESIAGVKVLGKNVVGKNVVGKKVVGKYVVGKNVDRKNVIGIPIAEARSARATAPTTTATAAKAARPTAPKTSAVGKKVVISGRATIPITIMASIASSWYNSGAKTATQTVSKSKPIAFAIQIIIAVGQNVGVKAEIKKVGVRTRAKNSQTTIIIISTRRIIIYISSP